MRGKNRRRVTHAGIRKRGQLCAAVVLRNARWRRICIAVAKLLGERVAVPLPAANVRKADGGACPSRRYFDPREDDMTLARPCAAMMLGLTVLLATSALARDDGRYANSPLKPWFESLHSEFGQCCSDADGYVVADVDWESDKGRYRVHLDGEWVLVPEGAVITEPNKIGRTMVWKHYIDGHPRVRCFMPGSMT